MTAHRKLTDEQIAQAKETVAKRREAMALANAYPTMEKLAEALHVTPRYLGSVIGGYRRNELAQAREQDAIDQLSAE